MGSTIGAKWLAAELQKIEPAALEDLVYVPWQAGGPLIERLSVESLAVLASVSGETIAELIGRNS